MVSLISLRAVNSAATNRERRLIVRIRYMYNVGTQRWSHHPEDTPGWLPHLHSATPAGLDRGQTKVAYLHHVVLVQEYVWRGGGRGIVKETTAARLPIPAPWVQRCTQQLGRAIECVCIYAHVRAVQSWHCIYTGIIYM